MKQLLSDRYSLSKIFSDWTISTAQFLIPLMIVAAIMNGFLFVRNPNMGADALFYHSAAHNFFGGHGWTHFAGSWAKQEPGYGILSYLIFLVIRDIEYSGMLVSAIAYLLMIPTVWNISNFLFGKRSAMLVSFWVTFWPILISYSFINLTDCVYSFVLFVGFSLYMRVLIGNRNNLNNFLLGFVLGFAYSIREPESLLVAGLVLLSLFLKALIKWIRTKTGTNALRFMREHFLGPFVAALGFFVVFGFYIAFIYFQSGVWSFSIKIDPILQPALNISAPYTSQELPNTTELNQNVTDPEIIPTPSDKTTDVQLWAGITWYEPVFLDLFKNFPEFVSRFTQIVLYVFAIPLALWVMSPNFLKWQKLNWHKVDSRKLSLIIGLVIFSSPAILHLLDSKLHSRYLMQYAIYFLIIAAFFSARLFQMILKRRQMDKSDLWMIVFCLCSLPLFAKLGTPTLIEVFTQPHGHLKLRAAGYWIAENVDEPHEIEIIAPRKAEVAMFYARGKEFPTEISERIASLTLAEIATYINSKKDTYLVLEPLYLSNVPQLLPLWEDPGLAEKHGLTLLVHDSSNRYKIFATSNIP